MELHQVIRAAREHSGLTLTEAARRLGIGKATLSRLETKKGPITATRLTEIAAVYHVKPSELLDGTLTFVGQPDDYERIGAVIELVASIARDVRPAPSPHRVKTATIEVIKLCADRAEAPVGDTAKRYAGIVKAILSA